jgi:hypothetical protein
MTCLSCAASVSECEHLVTFRESFNQDARDELGLLL